MKLLDTQKNKINKIGQKFDLRYLVLYGSYARGTERTGSDLDIAVYGNNEISFDRLLEIRNDLISVFGDNRERELDVKSLHNADILFRWEVAKEGKLLFGDETDFTEYYLYALRSYKDGQSLFDLRDLLIKKQQARLNDF